jgi:hypothetical protein
MSQYFLVGEEQLWNPSTGTARLFCHQVTAFEADLDLPSGVGPMHNDECQIDPVAFGAFVSALLARHRGTSHTITLALSDGFVGTVLVLAERAGVDIDWVRVAADPGGSPRDVQVSPLTGVPTPADAGSWEADLRGRAQELGRCMPR